jgi:hypothetical protein
VFAVATSRTQQVIVKLFACQFCGNILYFENRSCERCGHKVGFLPEISDMSALDPAGDAWQPLGSTGAARTFCANAAHDACNWLVKPDSHDGYCIACRHNGTVPNLDSPERLTAWRDLEFGKHRLFYSLLRWKLPLKTRSEDPEHGLIFNFLADSRGPKVLTGHDDGVITIALSEADALERERRRLQMGEPYRTLLGHFRHEVGHHYWDVLVRDGGALTACRAVFGDDSIDYEEALQRHYKEGAPPDWQQHFVSAYATTHPWEDFAETWAHYLHIVDTLEMAAEFNLDVRPALDRIGGLSANISSDPYVATDIQSIMAAWLPFVFAMNSVSRTMGARELYPFVLSPAVIEKLGFIHNLIHKTIPAAASQTSARKPEIAGS